MWPTHNDCGPLDVLGEASLWAALGEPPLQTIKYAGLLGVLLVLIALVAVVVALRANLRRVVSWVVIGAAVAFLLGADAMWFSAASDAEVIRTLKVPTQQDVALGAHPALAMGILGVVFALFSLAQLLLVRLRRRRESGGSRRAPLYASIALALAFAGALTALNARAHERIAAERERETREKLERSVAREERTRNAVREALQGRGSALGRGIKLHFDGDHRAALAALDEAVAAHPSDADALCWRGQVKNELGDRSGAADDLRRALAIDPENDVARVWLSLWEPWKPRR